MTPTQLLKKVRIGILGTGGMARQHAERFNNNPGCEIVAAADIDLEKAETFCLRHGIPRACKGLEEMVSAAQLQAVSVVLPDSLHAPMSVRALEMGLHVLCEKPLATSVADARRMCEVAERSGRIHMVNFSFRNVAALHAVREIVCSGVIGEVRHVEGSYLQSWLTATLDGGWKASPAMLWRCSTKHGSRGVLGDVGVHLIDWALFAVGPIEEVTCKLKTFDKAPDNRIGEYELDANDSAYLTVEFASGGVGMLTTTRWAAGHGNRISLRVFGTEGAVEIDTDLGHNCYRVCNGGNLHSQTWETREAPPVRSTWDRFVEAIVTGKRAQPDFFDGLRAQEILDFCLVQRGSSQEARYAPEITKGSAGGTRKEESEMLSRIV